MSPSPTALSGDEIVALSRKHTLFEWSAQGKVDPIPVARAKGVHFWTPEGKRFIDLNSQLMSVNIGHGDDRVVRAIQEQVATLAYVAPSLATAPRALLGAKLATLTPGDLDVFFFTTGGAEANENAVKLARQFTGRHKILARYRSYHGASAGAMALTGDPRRWPNEPGMPGVVHVLDPYHGIARGWDDVATALANLEEVIQLEGPRTIAALILETVTGTNGVLVPPDGYLQGVRELCTRHGILLVCDEVMAGFGRTGAWFAVDHWRVVPDLLTMAKGLTSSYVPLGAVAMRREIAESFRDRPFPGGLTYGSHPVACAAALATIRVYEEDGLVERAREMGKVLARLLADLAARHPSVGAVRSLGLFGMVELVRSRRTMEPLAPFNGTSDEMTALARFFRDEGLFTFVRWNGFFTNPPLVVTEADLREAFAILDRGLTLTDRAVKD
ncbi:MAG TPA: aminotransferase class III-fold pyridoxal phosphate-dependent enzyme [Anaeromyxobacter sp.]